MFWLTDRYGPRLTGSTEFEEAGDWAVKQLQEWGMTNVKKERFPFGRGWSLAKFHATMTEPRVMPIIGLPKAWSRGTNGTFTADVVRRGDHERGRRGEIQRPVARQDRAHPADARGPHARSGPRRPSLWQRPEVDGGSAIDAGAGPRAGRGCGWRRGRGRTRPGQRLQRQSVLQGRRRTGLVRPRRQQRSVGGRQRSDVADPARRRRHGVRAVRRLAPATCPMRTCHR